MKYILALLITTLFVINNSHSEEVENKQIDYSKFHYVIIPGQGNYGGTQLRESKIIPDSIRDDQITRIGTPEKNNDDDFGQAKCQRFLHDKIDALFGRSDIEKIIFNASSQGTQSLILYVIELIQNDANRGGEAWSKKIGALILDGAMISGSTAINHWVKHSYNYLSIPFGNMLSILPYSNFWIPSLAKATAYPHFNISAKQTIDVLGDIPPSLPIIITHSEYDYILPYTGAIAMYQKLREKSDNVYLITSHRNIHIDITSKRVQYGEKESDHLEISKEVDRIVSVINHVLKNNDLPFCSDTLTNANVIGTNILNAYQPVFARKHHQKYEWHEASLKSLHDTYIASFKRAWPLMVTRGVPVAMFFAANYFNPQKQIM